MATIDYSKDVTNLTVTYSDWTTDESYATVTSPSVTGYVATETSVVDSQPSRMEETTINVVYEKASSAKLAAEMSPKYNSAKELPQTGERDSSIEFETGILLMLLGLAGAGMIRRKEEKN